MRVCVMCVTVCCSVTLMYFIVCSDAYDVPVYRLVYYLPSGHHSLAAVQYTFDVARLHGLKGRSRSSLEGL